MIALIPPLLTLLSLALLRSPGAHLFLYADPDFGTLFNSALLLRGLTPHHIDHPGTPLQLLGAVVMLARGGLNGFLDNPLALHHSVNAVIVALFLAGQWFATRLLLRSRVPAPLAVLIACAPLLLFDGTLYLEHVNVEPLLGVGGVLLVAALASGNAPAAGLLLGLLLSLKTSTAPLLLTLFLLEGRRARGIAFAASAVFFFGLTAPIWSRYGELLRWNLALLSHDGIYGQGASGVPGIRAWFTNARALFGNEQVYGLWPALLAFPFLLARPSPVRRWPLVAAATLLLLLAIKHPATRYLIPFTALFGLALLRAPVRGLAFAAALFLPAYFWNLHLARAAYGWHNRVDLLIPQVEARLKEQYKGCTVILGSPTPLPAMGMFTGNLAAPEGDFAGELAKRYPGMLFLQPDLRSFSGPAQLPRGCVVLVAPTIGRMSEWEAVLGKKLELVDSLGDKPGYRFYRINR